MYEIEFELRGFTIGYTIGERGERVKGEIEGKDQEGQGDLR